jgi:hypothetical protein
MISKALLNGKSVSNGRDQLRRAGILKARNSRSRASESEAVGQLSPHCTPEPTPLLLANNSELIVVFFVVLVVLWDVLPIRPIISSTWWAPASTSSTIAAELETLEGLNTMRGEASLSFPFRLDPSSLGLTACEG